MKDDKKKRRGRDRIKRKDSEISKIMSNDRQQFFPIHNILECAKDIIFTSKQLSKKSRALTPASRAKAP